jgi:hypothetical protein
MGPSEQFRDHDIAGMEGVEADQTLEGVDEDMVESDGDFSDDDRVDQGHLQNNSEVQGGGGCCRQLWWSRNAEGSPLQATIVFPN